MFCATASSSLPICSRVRPEVRQPQFHRCFPRHPRSLSLPAARLATHSPSQVVSLPRKRVGCLFGGGFGADVGADVGGNHELFHSQGHILDHGQHQLGEDHNPGRDPRAQDQGSWPFDSTRHDHDRGVMATMAMSSEKTEGTSDTEQVKHKHISHAPFAGYEWPTIPWEALKLLSQAAVLVILKQCLGVQGLTMAAGCVWASYSTAFNLAAFLVAFTSLIKSCGLGSQAVDLAAVPCALYTTISFWALLTGFLGGPEGVWPHVTRNVSLPLIQGQAQLPLLAWNLAQNAEAVHLMSFAANWAPRVLAVAAYVAWMRICCPPAVELFDQLFGKPKSATTSGPASPPKANAQSDEEEQSAHAVPRHGWLAVQLLVLGVALNCARLTVGVQGCAVTVLTAASTLPATWAKGFLLVLTGSWLHKLWSKHRLGYLFSALYVLGIGLTINHTAGFSASFLSHQLPSLQLEHSTFQGIIKVPALLAQAVSGAHVNWGSMFLYVASCLFFADATQGLAEDDYTKKVMSQGSKPTACTCLLLDYWDICFTLNSSGAERLEDVRGGHTLEREWQEEEQRKIYRYWQLPAYPFNLGGQAVRGLMWLILGVGCVHAVMFRDIVLPLSRLLMSVQTVWLAACLGKVLHIIKTKAIWLLKGIKSGKSGVMRCSHAGKSQLLEATSAGLNARLGLAHATSEAHALASSSGVDQQPSTVWEVQLVKGDHSASQESQTYAGKLSAVRLLDIERGTEDWDEVPDSARMRADQAESALKQAQAQAEEEAGEQAQRSISLAAEAVREADLELQPAAQALKTAAAQEKEAKQRADGGRHADALKLALTGAEQAENALQEQQSKMAAREQEAEQSVAERAASIAFDRAAHAEPAVEQLQAEKAEAEREMMSKAHKAERVTEAAVQRAEVAEGALRRVDAVEHKIAKLQRVLKKWSVLQRKGKVVPQEVTIGSEPHPDQ